MSVIKGEKRDKRIFIPVTTAEKEWIKKVADRSVYGSVANYCREILFNVTQFLEQVDGDELRLEVFGDREIVEE